LECRSIDLLYHILQPQTPILEALQHPDTVTKANDFVLSHQSRESKLCADSLLVAGIAISNDETPNRISGDKKRKLISLVGSWIVDRLNLSSQGGVSESAKALQAFWTEKEKTTEGVLRVLKHLTLGSKNYTD
jgi:hypothetical protein